MSSVVIFVLVIYGYSEFYGEKKAVPTISDVEISSNDGVSADEIFGTTADLTPNFPIEINTATVEELVYIDNIGVKTAERIVEYAENFGFGAIEDLKLVDGIGDKTFQNLCDYLYVGDEFATESKAEIEIYVNLNNCTAEELIEIPGIGIVTAEAIVKYAQETGYSSLEDLLNVDGIGEKTLEKISDFVYIEHTDETLYDEKSIINLNNATLEELVSLPGIGEVTAEKILEYAKDFGFNSVQDLLLVDGIGESKLEKLEEFVCV